MKIFYKIDYILQKLLTTAVFLIPPFSWIKGSYFYLVHKIPFRVYIGYNVVITNFDAHPKKSWIKFKGYASIPRNVQIDISGPVEIGKNVTISENSMIITHKHEIDGVSLF